MTKLLWGCLWRGSMLGLACGASLGAVYGALLVAGAAGGWIGGRVGGWYARSDCSTLTDPGQTRNAGTPSAPALAAQNAAT